MTNVERRKKAILKFTNRFWQTENSVWNQPLFRPFNVRWTCACVCARVFASFSPNLFAYTCDQAPAITCAHKFNVKCSLYRVTMMTSIRNVFFVYTNLVSKPEKSRIIVISWSYFRRKHPFSFTWIKRGQLGACKTPIKGKCWNSTTHKYFKCLT